MTCMSRHLCMVCWYYKGYSTGIWSICDIYIHDYVYIWRVYPTYIVYTNVHVTYICIMTYTSGVMKYDVYIWRIYMTCMTCIVCFFFKNRDHNLEDFDKFVCRIYQVYVTYDVYGNILIDKKTTILKSLTGRVIIRYISDVHVWRV